MIERWDDPTKCQDGLNIYLGPISIFYCNWRNIRVVWVLITFFGYEKVITWGQYHER